MLPEFITLEGIEGVGKTTLQKKLANYFQSCALSVLCTREPGGCGLGQRLRHILLDPTMRPADRTELFLFLADRAQHVQEIIRPALAAKKIVLCDRYVDSTLVYQGDGRGIDRSMLQNLNRLAADGLEPDCTLLLDMDPAPALERARQRDASTQENEGRFESESLAFHTRIREGFLRLADEYPQRIIVLDAAKDPDAVLQQALVCLKKVENHNALS